MKRLTSFVPVFATAAVLVTGVAGPNASANQFTGSLAFSAAGVTTDNPLLPDATTFSLTGAFTTSETGEYTTLGVTNLTAVDFNGFVFNPPAASVSPLWHFDAGTNVFSFDATSVFSTWVPGVGGGEWVITGAGIAAISGFDDTPGTWTVNLSDSGNLSVGFDATAAFHQPPPSVPDGGDSVILLGGALTVMGLFARKFPG